MKIRGCLNCRQPLTFSCVETAIWSSVGKAKNDLTNKARFKLKRASICL